MLWLLLILVILAVAYAFRVPLLAKLTGQQPDRIRRAMERRRRR
jgi:hypothetical protein